MKETAYTLFAALMLLLLAACADKSPATGYTITGTAEGAEDGDTVYLCAMSGLFGMEPLDSTCIKGGKFQLKGAIEGAELRIVVAQHNGLPASLAMVVLENADINVTLKQDPDKSVVEGGPSQKLYKEYEAGANKIAEMMNTPWATAEDSTADEATRQRAQQQIDSLMAVQRDYTRKFIVDHVPSAFSDMLFGYFRQDLSEEQQEEILKLFGEQQPDYPVYKSVMAERKAAEGTAVGAKYTDIALPDTQGATIRVSNYVGKNKLTLIDFWASWCGPCRTEMPHVVAAYEKYHAKGFEVVGVSLDNDRSAWLQAIDQLKMPWPQMSDLKGWESAGAALYNVHSIPANVLIDQQGKIVAKDLRGDALLKTVGDLISQ
jgi:peroxiredoxin